MIQYLLPTALLFAALCLPAQSPADLAIPVTASAGLNPPAVVLSWPNPGADRIILKRRLRGDAAWTTLIDDTPGFQTGYFDTGVNSGYTYEYALERQKNGITALGFAPVAIFTPAPDSRGKLLVFIDSTTADLLGADLKVFKDALRGEGWQTVPNKTGPFTTPASIKNTIVNAWNADPGNVKAILLIGPVPVPYAGSTAWDGQNDHQGAWPADAWYGDIDGQWTDNTVNLPNTVRPANRNVPGDGKFDQNTLPSPVEIPVGRIDFSRLDPAVFGLNAVELTRRYLLKNARWRMGETSLPTRALLDDQQGWAAGTAPIADGYRNAWPLCGENQVQNGDFTAQGSLQPWLLAHGAADNGSGYTNAAGIGSSIVFAQTAIKTGFVSLSGAYFGDWGFENNPLLPALLAGPGEVLACQWSGQPRAYQHALAAGATLGECLLDTWNAAWNDGYPPSALESGISLSLQGDPTLRARTLHAPGNFSAVSNCNKVNLQWSAPPDSGILGYHVYRATSLDGPYLRQTPTLLTDLSWADVNVAADTFFYAVRAFRLESAPGAGVWYNHSSSSIRMVVFVPGMAPTVLGLGGMINCTNPALTLGANFQPPSCTAQWYKPNGQPHTGFQATEAGVYRVVATAPNGCTAQAFATVEVDTFLPGANIPVSLQVTCTNPQAQITVPPAYPNVGYFYNGIALTPGTVYPVTFSGLFVINNSQNGCSEAYPLQLTLDNQPPDALALSDGNVLGCAHPFVQLTGSGGGPGASYTWLGNGQYYNQQNIVVGSAGDYCLTVTGANGCTATDCVEVDAVAGALEAQIVPQGNLCDPALPVQLLATPMSGQAPFTYQWMNGNHLQQLSLPAGYVGSASVTITDADNCSATASFQVTPPITLIAQIIKETTPGQGDGSIDLLVLGGLAPFTYQWSHGAISEDVFGLNNVTYTVTVTGANGCSSTLVVPFIITSGVNDAQEAGWRLWPNPAAEVLYVQGEGWFQLLDAQGRVLRSLALQEAVTEIALHGLPAGWYWYRVSGSGLQQGVMIKK
jgi:hypothetical protein